MRVLGGLQCLNPGAEFKDAGICANGAWLPVGVAVILGVIPLLRRGAVIFSHQLITSELVPASVLQARGAT